MAYTATLSRTGDVYSVTAGALTGDILAAPSTRRLLGSRPSPAKPRPASPTNADSLTWRITFDENVQNVNAADFTVSGTTATVTSVATVTASTVFDVTVSGGDLANLNATVTLGLAAGQDIQDTFGNALTNTAPTGTNDNTYVVINAADMSVDLSGLPTTATVGTPYSGTIKCTNSAGGDRLGHERHVQRLRLAGRADARRLLARAAGHGGGRRLDHLPRLGNADCRRVVDGDRHDGRQQ